MVEVNKVKEEQNRIKEEQNKIKEEQNRLKDEKKLLVHQQKQEQKDLIKELRKGEKEAAIQLK